MPAAIVYIIYLSLHVCMHVFYVCILNSVDDVNNATLHKCILRQRIYVGIHHMNVYFLYAYMYGCAHLGMYVCMYVCMYKLR